MVKVELTTRHGRVVGHVNSVARARVGVLAARDCPEDCRDGGSH